MKNLLRALACLCTLFYLSISNATPVIQEIYYDQPGSDGSDVFTEIYGVAGFDFTGWRLDAINGNNDSVYRSIDLSGAVIPSDGVLLISTISANTLLAAMSDFTANVDWQNGPDSLWLIDNVDNLVDAIQYGATAFPLRGEGVAAADVIAGTSLSRRFAGEDSDHNLNDFIAGLPTPGLVNHRASSISEVPESSPLGILLLGLFMTIVTYRKNIKP